MDNRNEIRNVIDVFYGLISENTRQEKDWNKLQ